MVIVAKDNAEYLLKREKLLKDYDNYAKTRDLYSKTKITRFQIANHCLVLLRFS